MDFLLFSLVLQEPWEEGSEDGMGWSRMGSGTRSQEKAGNCPIPTPGFLLMTFLGGWH